MISPGRLRHVVQIEQMTDKQDSFGAPTHDWVVVHKNVFADVIPSSVREYVTSGTEKSHISARIVIRQRPNVTNGMRVIHNGTIYNIEGVLADKDSGLEYLTLPCSTGVNEG